MKTQNLLLYAGLAVGGYFAYQWWMQHQASVGTSTGTGTSSGGATPALGYYGRDGQWHGGRGQRGGRGGGGDPGEGQAPGVDSGWEQLDTSMNAPASVGDFWL